MRSDILPPCAAGWHSFLILEEMEAEGLMDAANGDEADAPPTKKGKITVRKLELDLVINGRHISVCHCICLQLSEIL